MEFFEVEIYVLTHDYKMYRATLITALTVSSYKKPLFVDSNDLLCVKMLKRAFKTWTKYYLNFIPETRKNIL